MPLVIAGILYVILAIPALAVVGVVCWARHKRFLRPLLGGAVGSLAGFVLGCGTAILFILTVPGAGANVGATAIVVTISLGVAMTGMIAGTVVSHTHGTDVG